eukprot:57675_1
MGNTSNKQLPQVTGGSYNKEEKIDVEKEFKWSKSNTKLETIHQTNSKIYACDARQIPTKNNTIMFASADQSGRIVITNMVMTKNKKDKSQIKYFPMDYVTLPTAWTMTLAISPTCKYMASGGLDNCVTVFIKDSNNKYQQHRQLMSHTGYVAHIKFIENGCHSENLLLSVSGDSSLILWDIDAATVLLRIDDASGDLTSVDHIYIEDHHIIAFSCIDATVYIRDITKTIEKYQNKSDIDEFIKNKDTENNVIVIAQDFSNFTTDVNDVCFSPMGEFLAATSDDGTYAIYTKNYKYDSFWQANILEWTFLCSRSFKDIDDNWGCGQALMWVDEETLMVGAEDTKKLYSTYMKRIKEDSDMVQAVNEGVEVMIRSLSYMSWMGLVGTVANEILQYFTEYKIFDYQYQFTKNVSRISCLASCKWNNESNDFVMMFGCWDLTARAIVPQ